MVQNIITIGKREDRVLNIVKAKFGLKNKSDAVALLAKNYEENFLEPELRPEYVKKLASIQKEKGIPFRNMAELRKIIEG